MVNMWTMQLYALFHLPLPDLPPDHDLFSGDRNLANLDRDLAVFQMYSTNIDRIANLNAGGKRAH